MKFMTTWQKAHDLGPNATSMNMAKNLQIFLKFKKKQRGSQNIIKKLVVDDKEITDQTQILEYIREFYETLFKTR